MQKMTGNQKRAYMQVKHAFDQIVGGYENSVLDGEMKQEEMPTHDEFAQMIYDGVMYCSWGPGWQGGRPDTSIRFAGKAFIKQAIEDRLTKEGY